jgi:Flp pilus assembly protein TadD
MATSEAIVARARKHLRRGETRKALTALREACARDERAAWLWTVYGALLAKSGRREEAAAALRHALWLRRTSGDERRARSTKAVLDRVELADAA